MSLMPVRDFDGGSSGDWVAASSLAGQRVMVALQFPALRLSIVLTPHIRFTTEIKRWYLCAVRAPWMPDALRFVIMIADHCVLRLIKAGQQTDWRNADDSG